MTLIDDKMATPDLHPADSDSSEYELLMVPSRGWVRINWRELKEFRELLFFLAYRDIKVRYKQTSLGIAWAVIQPLTTMLIFSVIFGMFANIKSEGMPYPVFVFAGLIPWTFFSNGVSAAALSLVNQQNLLTKIYFPRLFVPTASVGALMVDMAISLGLFVLLMIYYGFAPSWQVVFLPIPLALTVVATLGLGYSLAALIVLYRDIKHVVTFLLQILMYVSPVIWPMEMIPARYHWLEWVLALNPMFGLIGAFRSSVLGTPWHPAALAVSTLSTLALFTFGLFYFQRTERRFADIA